VIATLPAESSNSDVWAAVGAIAACLAVIGTIVQAVLSLRSSKMARRSEYYRRLIGDPVLDAVRGFQERFPSWLGEQLARIEVLKQDGKFTEVTDAVKGINDTFEKEHYFPLRRLVLACSHHGSACGSKLKNAVETPLDELQASVTSALATISTSNFESLSPEELIRETTNSLVALVAENDPLIQ